ncbi:aspartate-semialdehyde dehydrogenase [Macrococcoides bohemicum]|uniref:Aspartate-semialdehyde dehydrogenase n=1 Tax=Macrococcoides bohemicum TaxID=1903056 RepID=A0AAE7Q2N4_9STAP|nr:MULTISPECIES: aspartate-semialdehyde dehydrogenase [Macrococcus]ATD30370.1 aspartate-semialdehyde dehydrogenase [Macrococcus sp. IME1552]QRN49880.1 aspartate-semialdehyde dehydrogenase [Macrococcus bohemicus]QYA41348.1 aspartate-semialdehyde dehydrogenase [Macrococcus bohemicus]QYA43772.1 aspartate-semialdehyde dehydrogenase [Macrococcus bohemicus]
MYKIAVVGATGLVGQKMLEVLERKAIPFNELTLFTSARSANKEVVYQGKTYITEELTEEKANEKYDFVLMSAGGSTSLKFSPLFEQAGSIVIDNSSAYRMEEDIDLIVPEVNSPQLNRKIIANPNCSTIQSVVPLKPLQDKYGLKRVAYTTYQAVSGSGVAGRNDLINGAKGEAPKNYPHPIYNNVLPHIDVFLENGYTKEEQKMIDETKKILNLPDLKVTATCVRVPVQDSHSVAINVTLEQPATVKDLRNLFEQTEGVVLIDDVANNEYPLAINTTGKDEVFVGRIREDDTLDNSFHIWCTADNLLKGAALNAVQILEQIHLNNNK